MSNRRQQLLSQLKNNLDIVTRAIGLDKNKPSPSDRPAESSRFESDIPSSTSSFSSKGHDLDTRDIDTRDQGPEKAPLFPVDRYSRNYAPNNGTAGIHDDIGEHWASYDDRYSMHPERAKLFPTSSTDIESEDAFLYGTGMPAPKTQMQASGYASNSSGQGSGKDLMEKISYLLHGSSSAKKPPVTGEEMQVDEFAQKDHPRDSFAGDVYNEAKRRELPSSSSVGSQDGDETVDRILKSIGLDGRISDVVQGIIRKDPRLSRPGQASTQPTMTPSTDKKFPTNQVPPITTNSSSDQISWNKATQQFLNKISCASTGETPRGPDIPFASPYPPPPNWNSQRETKMPDSSGGLETRLYFKAKPEGTALPGLSYRQNDSPMARALNETLSNIKALEEALANLTQGKTNLMLRPPGSQRDSLMLENMRRQEELSGQILALRENAKDLSQQLKNQTSSLSIQQTDNAVKNSPTSLPSQPVEEPRRESSASKQSNRTSTDRKSRSRSHSREKKQRSRSRSRDRKRTHGRRRSRSRESYRHRNRNRNRSRSRDRSRSRERRRSHDRNAGRRLSDADRKALGFGTAARKLLDARAVAEKAEDKEKKALELALSMYMNASEYYNGTNIWCQKCDVIFGDVFGLCQHLHSEMHQSKVDPDYNKPRPPYAPVIPPGVPSAPSRGYEFILPLQAFFCSLCCEFSKDINKAEEHVKSVEHNKKFKQFLNDNSIYELKFLKDVMMAIARAKVAEKPQLTESKTDADVTDTSQSSNVFLKPEDDSKQETRDKFQIKFTGAAQQGNSRVIPKSPDVEIVHVQPSSKKNLTEDTKKTSAPSNVLISKVTGFAKKPGTVVDSPRPSGWVLKADAHFKPTASPFPKTSAASSAPLSLKNSLQSDKPKGKTLDIFSPDSPKTSAPFSKLPTLSTGGRFSGGKLQATSTMTTTTTSSTGALRKSEEAVLNIGDFEIFDEC